jgi:protein-tyrosine phosphatase
MSLFQKLKEQYGLEELTDDNGCTGEAQRTMKEELRVLLANARLVEVDSKPELIPTTNFVYIGSLGSAYCLPSLQSAQITHILCLSAAIRLKFPSIFIYKQVPMIDKPDFNLLLHIIECVEFIRSCRDVGGRILIHCYQGISRSAAVCIAFLICDNLLSLEEGLNLVRSVRPQASPNSGFMTALKQLEQRKSSLCMSQPKQINVNGNNI